MSNHQSAKTRYAVASEGNKFAYRKLGVATGAPLLFLNHFRATMDHWDPLLVNSIAASRNVILYDYSGVGRSTGEVASTVRGMAADVIKFLGLIHEKEVDVLGLSIGGMVAQLVGLNADPNILKVRKLVIAGAGPSIGPDVVPTPNGTEILEHSLREHMELPNLRVLFFPMSSEGQYAAERYWARIYERSITTSGEEHSKFLSDGFVDGGKGMTTMNSAMNKFFTEETSHGYDGSYNRLAELKMPILIANGDDDYILPAINCWVLQQKVLNGQLIIYPQSGHGFLFQYATRFARDVVSFLDM